MGDQDKDDEAARKKRAAKLRKQIQDITEESGKKPRSPRDFVDEKMREREREVEDEGGEDP